ncbi:MAG: ribosomal protein S18-alanine N-acetyltransferase [bacterium]
MCQTDLQCVYDIDQRSYPFAWSMDIFSNCLAQKHYRCKVIEQQQQVFGYFVLQVILDEAHLLNICVDPDLQKQGYGQVLLLDCIQTALNESCNQLFLEVRPSNLSAISIYQKHGFSEIAHRPGYYPADNGREDAIVMAKQLFPEGELELW